MPDVRTAYGPVGWAPIVTPDAGTVPGVWAKDLPTGPGGDAFSLLRLAPGAAVAVSGAPDDRFLLLTGEVAVAGDGGPDDPRPQFRGDWFGLPAAGGGGFSAPRGALLLRVTGARLGDPVSDAFGPTGWNPSGPGQWYRLLLAVTVDDDFDERMVGLAYMEPGSTSPLHPHPSAHRFLFLEGAAEDELVHPDGRRHSERRVAGDFVDYPTPVEHLTHTRDGCLLLFVHEPLGR